MSKKKELKNDLIEMYRDNGNLETNQEYKNNVKETAIDFIEDLWQIRIESKEIRDISNTKEVARCIVAFLRREFDIRERITIEEEEDEVIVVIGDDDDNFFAELTYANSYMKYNYSYNVFNPNIIIKKYHNFEEKLRKFIRLLTCMEIFLNFDNKKCCENFVVYKMYQLKILLNNFYDIVYDEKYKYKYYVIPKNNKEIREEMEKLVNKKPSLRQVLDFMYAGDYKNALRVLVDDILDKHKDEYKNKIQQGNETLFDIDKYLDKLSNFVNNYKIRHSKNRKVNKQVQPQIEPTDEQLKVHLDFGLSIYRLFCIYQDDNDKKSAQK